jgi:hypothetical protein
MHNARSMCGSHSAGNLYGEIKSISKRKVGFRDQLAERLAVNKLRGDKVYIVDMPNLVNGYDVRMIEAGCRLSFLHKTFQPVFIGCELSGEYLERDLSSEGCVLCKIYLSHPPFAQK